MSAEPSPARRRGRPAKLSREAIARAALRLGFGEASLVRVAAALGVSHAALYTHVTDRDDLARASLDLLYGEAPWPRPGRSWRTYLQAEARVLWRVLERDPALIAATGGMSPAALEHFDAAARVLLARGFSPTAALLAVDTVFDLTHDVHVRGQALTNGDDAWPAALSPRLRGPTRRALADPLRWFERKLQIVLDGLAVGVAPGGARGGEP